MTLLTEANLKMLYKTFCRMAPFDKLDMPEAHKIKFIVTRRQDIMGEFQPEHFAILISSARNGHFDTISKTLLHEMAHLHCYYVKDDDYEDHNNRRFKRILKKIAELYGFDPKEL